MGVVVVGSLDWESKDYGETFHRKLTNDDRKRIARRTEWRQGRLKGGAAAEFIVRVPIRYGRESITRGHTFTMVFSPECAERLGTAKAIQCKRDVSSIDELVAEAVELWVAESDESHRGQLSAGWGCVVLVVPEEFLNHPDKRDREMLLDAWATRISQAKSYGKLGFSERDRTIAGGPVIADGRLRIAWPTLADGSRLPLDLLLATATNPEIGPQRSNYPTAKSIAEAWRKASEFAYYFHFNRQAGIHTIDDEEIERLLK